MTHTVISHTDLNGLQYLTVRSEGFPDRPRIYRMKNVVVHDLASFEHIEHAHRYGRKRAAALGVPYLHGYGRHLQRIVYGIEYFATVSEAARRFCLDARYIRAMANGGLNDVTLPTGESVAIRWMYSKKSKASMAKIGRPLGSKNRPKTKPDTTGWPSISWDVLPHPRGYKAWRAAVRAHQGYVERFVAYFPSHAAADRFALAVAGA